MPKGPLFRQANADRHDARVKPWYVECSEVDVERLRIRMSIDFIRARGGLTYEERQILRARIAAIQIPKERKTRRLEQRMAQESGWRVA